MTWDDTLGKDFKYNISLNGSYNKNEVGNIPTSDGIIHGAGDELYNNASEFYRAENGQPSVISGAIKLPVLSKYTGNR